MVARVFGADAAVAVAVEAGHGFLGEEGEGLLEDWMGAVGCQLGGLERVDLQWWGGALGLCFALVLSRGGE